jgi:putative ABC transport system permease protein
MEAIHFGWANGVPLPGRAVDYSDAALLQLQPDSVTAVLLGLSSRSAVFGVQRSINDYKAEALTAILPGVALAELWTLLGAGERLLGAVTLLVMLATLLGMATMLLASMRERAREIALYRAIGARPWFILALIELEAVLITLGASVLGVLGVWAGLAWGQTLLQERFGLFLSSWPVSVNSLVLLAVVLASAVLLALIPAVAAYRQGMAGRLKPAG